MVLQVGCAPGTSILIEQLFKCDLCYHSFAYLRTVTLMLIFSFEFIVNWT